MPFAASTASAAAGPPGWSGPPSPGSRVKADCRQAASPPADPGHSQYLPHWQQPVSAALFAEGAQRPPPRRDRAGVQRRSAAPFLADLQLQRIHPVKLQGKRLLASLSVLWRLRRQHYDRVYVPFASSTDHLIAGWVKAREKLGFDDAKGDALFPSPHPQPALPLRPPAAAIARHARPSRRSD